MQLNVLRIARSKASVGAAAASALNPSFKPKALQNRVSPETEGVFNDSFWGSLDIVVNALDNVAARLYVDSRCVYFKKPLLESGTLGPKCNTQAIIPDLTENYGRGPHIQHSNDQYSECLCQSGFGGLQAGLPLDVLYRCIERSTRKAGPYVHSPFVPAQHSPLPDFRTI